VAQAQVPGPARGLYIAHRFLPEAVLNPVRTDLGELMFSSTGRLSRAPFLGAAAVLLVLAAAYEYGLHRGLGLSAGWIVYPALLFPTACILSKRLHDRGRAGWWAFLVVWALVEAWPAPSNLFGYVALAVLAVTFLDLGLTPGEADVNRFGANPAGARQRSGPTTR
jgi:uncharacterized membrane protein YhaH (DUF805 family)